MEGQGDQAAASVEPDADIAVCDSFSLLEPEADGAVSDSFSQLWTDVMGMLVSLWAGLGEGRQEGNNQLRKAFNCVPPRGTHVAHLVIV